MIKIALSKLNNDQLHTVAVTTFDIISPTPVTELGIEPFFTPFKTSYEKYEEARESVNLRQKIVKSKDETRDDFYRCMEKHLDNFLFYPDDALKERVQSALYEMNRHGPNIISKPYDDETGILRTIIAKIESDFMDVINDTNNIWFDLLKGAQADFEKTVHDLSDKKVEKNKIESPSNLRPDLIASLRKLFTFLPLQHELTGNEQLGKIIELLTEELRRF